MTVCSSIYFTITGMELLPSVALRLVQRFPKMAGGFLAWEWFSKTTIMTVDLTSLSLNCHGRFMVYITTTAMAHSVTAAWKQGWVRCRVEVPDGASAWKILITMDGKIYS